MNENKRNTATDWTDPDDAPELTDEFFEQADEYRDGKLIRRGASKAGSRKVLLSVRYSPEVVDYFRATGEGWQARMDMALKEWIKVHTSA